MKKRLLIFSFMLSLFFIIQEDVFAKSTISLVVNGREQTTEAPPIIISNRTMVSLKSLEELNLLLDWNNDTKQVTIKRENTKDSIVLTVGKNQVIVGDNKVELDVAPKVLENRVYVPIRFISEQFDSIVKWDNVTSTVLITTTISEYDLEIINKDKDLVKVRKLVYDLPAINVETLSNTSELSDSIIYFPEGEALRYFYKLGTHIKYYEIQNNEKVLVWEAIEDYDDTYSKELGKRPDRGNEVYFYSILYTDDVEYGRVMGADTYYGKKGYGSSWSKLILEIPNEVRIDVR